MAPKSPFKKTVQASTKHANTPSEPAGSSQEPAGHVNYAEVQAEELEVLRAVYMDDYQTVVTKGPWKTAAEKAFTLLLRASSDGAVFVKLGIKLTATYPKSLPLITVEDSQGCDSTMLRDVKATIDTKSAELVGEVMIHEIATSVLDMLEDAVQRRDDDHQKSEMLPSLEEERTRTEQEAARLAQEEQQRMEAEEAALREEEERGIEDLVQRERARQQQAKQRRDRSSDLLTNANDQSGNSRGTVDFQQRISLQSDGVDISFSAVDRLVNIRDGPLTRVYTVQPSKSELAATSKSALVLKKVCIY